MNHKCKWCQYEGKESEFLSGSCPACCANNMTGKVDPNEIPTVFHISDEEIDRLAEEEEAMSMYEKGLDTL